MDMLRYLDLFLAESREHLEAAYDLQLRLEAEAEDEEAWKELLRHAHSLKGMAATMGYRSMVTLAHALEDLLQGLQNGTKENVPAHLSLLAESLICLGHIVDRVEQGETTDLPRAEQLAELLRNPVRPGEPPPEPTRECLRASAASPRQSPSLAEDSGSLESLFTVDLHLEDSRSAPAQWIVSILGRLGVLGRVVQANPPLLAIDTGRFEGRLRLTLASLRSREEIEEELRDMVGEEGFALEVEPPRATWAAKVDRRTRWVRVRADQLDNLLEGILELRLEHGRIKSKLPAVSDGLREHVERSEFQLKELYGHVMELRLVPFDSVGHRLHQTVRDLARELGKEVDFEILGGHVLLDRVVLDALLDPLLHLVRNALDHGLEPPHERLARGKPRHGCLRLGLQRRGDRVRFSVEDDGRGLNAEQLKRKALDLGLIGDAEAASLSDDQALMLTTLPRFSTAREVNHISGRGVGLDVVRTSMERLGGLLQIRSRPEQGTELHLWVPPSLALIRSLLVRSRRELYAVPLDAVERTIDLDDNDLDDEGRDPPFLRLDRCLGLASLPACEPGRATRAVLLQVGGRRVALVVDEVLGSRDLVVKPLPAPLSALREYSGAALMEDGTIAVVLDPFYLVTAKVPAQRA